jgi:predicted anti-sigma-YlaC factor YlaD
MNDHCDDLDSYLADDLSAMEAAAFDAHLLECASCSDAVSQQCWIDGLLATSTTAVAEVSPHNVLVQVRASIARRKRRNQSLQWALAAAATVVVAFGWTILRWQRTDSPDGALAKLPKASDLPSAESARTQATFVASATSIAVPVESHHPNVTIVRVFPTYRPQFEAATTAAETTGVDPQSWQRLSNGG